MVDLARYFLQFTQDESCGKCVPCRLGTKRMLETLERITAGNGREGDIELLEELSDYIDAEACTGCMLCAKKCPTSCISGEKKQPHVIDVSSCIKCDTCRQVCKFDAVKVHSGIEQPAAAIGQEA